MIRPEETASLEQVASRLLEGDSFVVCGHVSPDGDCIGSQLALAAALRSCGKKAVCLLAKGDTIDYGLRFLPGVGDMVPAADFTDAFDTFVSVDVPNAKRMGQAAEALHARARKTVTIDHHPSEKPMSQTNYIDSDAPASTVIVWNIIPLLGVRPDTAMASCCYTGLITDTGRFQYQNTDTAALDAAASMVAAGADPSAIAQEVYQSRSRASLSLEARVLAHMRFSGGGAFVVSHLTRSDFVETGAVKSDAEPLIDLLRSVRGVRVACILRQQEQGVRGSLRAKDDTDVAAIAAHIGGGGHRAAAGFTFDGSLEEARECIASAFVELESK